MKKIVFVSTAMTAPYVLKKIKAFRSHGFDTILYSYNRGNDFERIERQDLGEIVDLGYLESGKGYFKKLVLHIKSLKKVYAENDTKNSVVILFMFDLALINLLLFKRKIVYHISDLTYTKTKIRGLVALFREIDRRIIRRSFFTMVTSQGFCDYLFPEGDIHNKLIVVPNLLQEDNPYERGSAQFLTLSQSIRFGFVGLSRYESPIRIAKVIGEKFPKHSFAFYGNGVPELMGQIESLTKKYNNISSHGRFNSSTDLASIYSTIDILICCYDVKYTNVRIAEPNKLYEAIFFNKPIVVSDDTYLSERVLSLGVGYKVNAMDERSIISFINSLNVESVNATIKRISAIPTSSLIDSGDVVIRHFEERVFRT